MFPLFGFTGCGSRIALRALERRLRSATAAPAPPCCIRHWRRSASQPFDKILRQTAHSSRAPRTQFAAKFPCMCHRRRRNLRPKSRACGPVGLRNAPAGAVSADGDGFKISRRPERAKSPKSTVFIIADLFSLSRCVVPEPAGRVNFLQNTAQSGAGRRS